MPDPNAPPHVPIAGSAGATPSSPPPPGTAAPRTVLVVDDEKNIRRTLQLVLEGEGYQFLGAETAMQALAILALYGLSIERNEWRALLLGILSHNLTTKHLSITVGE